MRRSTFVIFMAVLSLAAACGDAGDAGNAGDAPVQVSPDSGQPPVIRSEDAVGAVPAARDPSRRPGSIGAASDATQVAASLSEFAIAVSPDTIPAGETTFNIENRGERRHIIEVRHTSRGRWRTTPIAPGTSVGLTMALPAGTYEVVSTDADYVTRGMRATLVVR
jgi:hypothetical protein